MAKKSNAAQQSRHKGKPVRRSRRVLPVLLITLTLAVLFFSWMHLQARVVHLKQAEVYLPDLPARMEGTRLLYLSDLNIRNASDARACMRLLKQLSRTEPDLLVLGGDYSAPTLLDVLNESEGSADEECHAFIERLASFPAALGKYAVAGENDLDDPDLAAAFAAAGVNVLDDDYAVIEKGGEELVLVGLSDDSLGKTPYAQISRAFSGDECVIAVAHNPASYIDIRVNEARGGGAWADLVLSGHTLGGQIRLLGRTLRSFSDEEARCIGGWYYVDDLPMLVSQGVGCEGAMLRLDTQSEAWLMTLRRTQELNLPDLTL